MNGFMFQCIWSYHTEGGGKLRTNVCGLEDFHMCLVITCIWNF